MAFTISQPKTFKCDVPIPQLGTDPILVPFEFNVFTHEQLAKMQDEWEKQPSTEDNLSNLEYIKKTNALNANKVKELVKGWGFDEPLNEKNINHLINTIIGSEDAILRTYYSELGKARMGN